MKIGPSGKGGRHLLCDDQRCASVPASGTFRQKVPDPFSRRGMLAFLGRPGKMRSKVGLALALLAVLAAVAWHASLRRPTGPDEGTAIQGDVPLSPAAHRAIRVGTFNIHGGKGADDRRDLDRTADCLGGLDLVGLNEVRAQRTWSPRDQAEALAQRLGLDWLFAPAEHRWYGTEHFGNAILGRLPVTAWHRVPLRHRYDQSYRNMLTATVLHPDGEFRVVVTHLVASDGRDRREQLRAVIAAFKAIEGPAILLGDLNSAADDPQMQELLAAPGVEDPLGQRLGPTASSRIDWILTRGFRTIDAGVIDSGASDHPLYWAEVELSKPRKGA
jgi:endonuclease/exonuclease/phosphatase family metal-dependent hydrolase